MEWTREQILARVTTDRRWRHKALLALYERQTADEQMSEEAKYRNRQGFNCVDAEILSSFAKQLKARGQLSEKQDAILKKRIREYGSQLAKIANGEL